MKPKNFIIDVDGVMTDGKLSKSEINNIKSGLKINSNSSLKADISFSGVENNMNVWDIILTEGKNREIKIIFNYFSINVVKLHRYEFAGLTLKGIKEGKFRKINKKEINKLKKIT